VPSALSRRGIATLLCLGSLVTACGDKPPSSSATVDSSESTGPVWTSVTVDADALQEWDPVFTDVAIASHTEVAAIEDRVVRAAEQTYTTAYSMEGLVFEVAHTPDHLRIAVGSAFGDDLLEVHLAPDDSVWRSDAFLDLAGHEVVAVCPADYEVCIDPSAIDDTEEQTPHMFDNFTDTFYFYALLAAGPSLQTDILGELMSRAGDRPVWGTAVAESPYGSLDCVLVGPNKPMVSSSEGEQVFRGGSFEDPLITSEPIKTASACVDRRGLLIQSTAEFRGWSRFEPDVDGLVDELPWPLRD